MELSKSDYWYCYDAKVMKWLRQKKITYICTGRNMNSDRQFWQYLKNNNLQEALNELKTVHL